MILLDAPSLIKLRHGDLTIAGQTAQCVDVPITNGTTTYCVLESGALAEFVGGDVTIELTSYSPGPDTTKFTSG